MLPEDAMKLVDKDGAIRFEVHAKPRAKKSRLVGERGDALEIALAAPPVDGAANEELVRFVARLLGVPRRQVALVRGETSREKLVAVTGLSLAELTALLQAALPP
jgi:uncharacterized protein (TIGR00251 family)